MSGPLGGIFLTHTVYYHIKAHTCADCHYNRNCTCRWVTRFIHVI